MWLALIFVGAVAIVARSSSHPLCPLRFINQRSTCQLRRLRAWDAWHHGLRNGFDMIWPTSTGVLQKLRYLGVDSASWGLSSNPQSTIIDEISTSIRQIPQVYSLISHYVSCFCHIILHDHDRLIHHLRGVGRPFAVDHICNDPIIPPTSHPPIDFTPFKWVWLIYMVTHGCAVICYTVLYLLYPWNHHVHHVNWKHKINHRIWWCHKFLRETQFNYDHVLCQPPGLHLGIQWSCTQPFQPHSRSISILRASRLHSFACPCWTWGKMNMMCVERENDLFLGR